MNINLNYPELIINQDVNGKRKEFCYSEDGNCRECRYVRECEWFLYVNRYIN